MYSASTLLEHVPRHVSRIQVSQASVPKDSFDAGTLFVEIEGRSVVISMVQCKQELCYVSLPQGQLDVPGPFYLQA